MTDTSQANRNRMMSPNQKNYLQATDKLIDMEIEHDELERRSRRLKDELHDVDKKLRQLRDRLVTQKALIVCYTNGEDLVAAKLRICGDEK